MKDLFSQFKENVNEGKSISTLFRFGINGVISTARQPLTFLGVNLFDSNIGGCININNAKVDVNGTMDFINNSGTPLGGAVRIVGFALVSYVNALILKKYILLYRFNCFQVPI